ncbi:MAG: peptidylprolyl isomerase, partial [Candidatus Acidiferrales bacterium]
MRTKSAAICGLLVFIGLAAFCSPLFSQNSQTTQDAGSVEVPLQVIVVRTPEEAQAILERLKNGEDFGALAKENSIDPTASSGGFMGFLAPDSLRPELRDALKGLAAGQITGVIDVPSGYAILKVMANGSNVNRYRPSGMGDVSPDLARSFDLAATGAVKYAPPVDGLGEMEIVLSQFPKPRGWNADPDTACAIRKQSVVEMIAKLSSALAPENQAALSGRAPIDVMQLHVGLAQLYAFQGDMTPSIEHYEAAYRIALSDVPAAVPQEEESLGIVYLHKSEMDNDVYSKPGQKCIFPMRPGTAYEHTDDSQKAVDYFLKYLETKPDELEVKWLLNLAYMTMGKYPGAVPQKY